MLVVTDYPFTSDLNIQVSGTRIEQPEPFTYGGKPQCPLLRCAWGGKHPLFAPLYKEIATNCPSSVTIDDGARGVQPLLTFFNVENGGIEFRDHYMVGSPKDAPPQGRILFIAGQGMFMNGMMLRTDNDNFDFAVNAIRWLREGPDGTTRSRALLLVDGKIVTDFNMDLSPGMAPPPIPIPPVKALNRLIRGMEEERLFHKILHGLLGDHADRVIGVMFAIASFGLLIYGAKKFLEARFHHETGVPRMVGIVTPLVSGVRRGQQRQLALYDQPNAAKESRQLVRDWLRTEFGVQPEQWSANTPIEFRAAGAFWTRRALQRRADEVLRVARGAELAPVSRDALSRVVESLSALTEAQKAGRLVLLVDGKNVRQGKA